MRAHRWLRPGLVLAAVFTAGCDGGELVAPSGGPQLLGPSGAVCYVGQAGVQLLDTGLELELAFHAERQVGSDGTFFGIGDSRMIIPAGAVAGETRFVMDLTIGRHIIADFGAYDANGMEVTSFAVPVTVEIGYHRLQGYDPSQLILVWLVDGTPEGERVAVPTTVDTTRKRIIAELDHFSRYAIGIN